jgi:hypothetical protein
MALFDGSLIQASNANGNALAGAKWWFYQSGGLTPANVYSDSALSTSLGATVTADSAGRFVPIYLDDAVEYRAILKNAAGTTVSPYDIDPVNPANVDPAEILRGDPASPAWNLFIGTDAGNLTTTTLRTTLVGVGAGQAITSGNLNTAFGSLALNSATTGAVNSAFGADALNATTTGEYNDAFGVKALTNNITGSRNKAFGQSALLYNETGNDNCAFGQSTSINNLSGSRNSAFGNNAMAANITGNDNCAFGANALYYNTADNNCAFGKDSMFTNGTGSANSAVGYQSLYSNTTGSSNCAFGQITLYSNTTGVENTGLGFRAGYGAAGDEATSVDTYCTFIGAYASRVGTVPTATVLTNATAIGYNAKVTASNQVTIGNASVTALRVPGASFVASTTDLQLSKTSTAAATTGAQTISKPAGSVNFAAAATSLVVTNALVTANSIIIATVNTNDATMKTVLAVAGAGSFTLHANAAATAETRVSFLVIN